MAWWKLGKSEKTERSLPLAEIWAQAAHDLQPVSLDKFVSSQWQPVSDDAPYNSIYREAFHTEGNIWTIREWVEDHEGCVTPEIMVEQCSIFGALKSIGEFESTRNTEAAGTPHEKMQESAPGKHYIDTAHEHALFVDADSMVHFNNNGTPVNAEGVRFAKEELALVGAMTPPPNSNSYDTHSIVPLFDGVNTASTACPVNLAALQYMFKDVIHHLKEIQKCWTAKKCKWTVGGQSKYDETFLQFHHARKAIEDHRENDDAGFQHVRQSLELTVQALYTAWFAQTMKYEDVTDRYLLDSIKERFDYSTKKSYWRSCPDIEIKKLKKLLQSSQKDIGAHNNYSPLITVITRSYTPREYSELFDKALEAIKTQADNLANPKKVMKPSLKEFTASTLLPTQDRPSPP